MAYLLNINRRRFLGSGAALAASSLLPSRLCSASEPANLAADPLRPQFHLLPAHNWMNDPNGPIFIPNGHGGGEYHMFFQYNPQGATWGNMSWNHAVSPDMVHWRLLPVAMEPTIGGYDSYGVFSGSALQIGKRTYVVYTGTKQGSKELATIAGDSHNVQEAQCLTWSDDPRLIHWTKAAQPILPLPPPGMKITGFRDPSIWQQDGCST
jgi:beta-fructofuranosidase